MKPRNPALSMESAGLTRIKRAAIAVLPLAVFTAASFTPTATARQASPNADAIRADVDPLYKKYCYGCHSGDAKSGGIDLTKDNTALLVQKNPQNWQSSARRIREKSMPPQGAPHPSDDERAKMAEGMDQIIALTPDTLVPKDPGKVLIHRLNRQEYNNTVHDLFGITSNPADQFPADSGGGGGFDNNADTLYVPPILMERYLEAAQSILKEVKPDRLFLVRPGKGVTPLSAARATLQQQATRAYRRPSTDEEVVSLLRLYGIAVKQGKSWEDAIRYAMQAVLLSPNFLFRVEKDNGDNSPSL